MKDATNLRKASGRRFVAFDPEISEWRNPSRLAGYSLSNVCESEPGEVKHLSTRRKREQHELRSLQAYVRLKGTRLA